MGQLIISGTLRVSQFWPQGRSDADTAHVILRSKQPFVFVNNAGKRAETKAFDNAESVGKHGPQAVIQTSKAGTRSVTIRFQGIDAPELHYQPEVPGSGGKGVNHPFRQSMGETSADALHAFLAAFGQADLPCEVITMVNKPSDVCDVFGRMVGNVVLTVGGSRIDLNHWLTREGWVLPGFYNSMSKLEIAALLVDHDAAKQNKRGLFSKKGIVTTKLAPFDPERVEGKGPANFKPFSDKGPVNFPKFFRRQAERHVREAIGENVQANLKQFIATKNDDLALSRADFLKLNPPVTGKAAKAKFKQLATFLGANTFPTGPETVFFENDTKLVKAGTNTEIKAF